jgi:hypothetical protein
MTPAQPFALRVFVPSGGRLPRGGRRARGAAAGNANGPNGGRILNAPRSGRRARGGPAGPGAGRGDAARHGTWHRRAAGPRWAGRSEYGERTPRRHLTLEFAALGITVTHGDVSDEDRGITGVSTTTPGRAASGPGPSRSPQPRHSSARSARRIRRSPRRRACRCARFLRHR